MGTRVRLKLVIDCELGDASAILKIATYQTVAEKQPGAPAKRLHFMTLDEVDESSANLDRQQVANEIEHVTSGGAAETAEAPKRQRGRPRKSADATKPAEGGSAEPAPTNGAAQLEMAPGSAPAAS